ncbi:hypothetical protein PISMIDRAFT_689228 [Pisolithus microcarpus 441]|uniref:T6SS Phospholipase effector Tle1-like catalytic domain-containing protein n=1 Tax=Pisolithus microcarpus 441 TaxID=765257 RepID=A0A0C9YFP1_9AGAM|nr:hypothetical protein PISMIDRAFT_689228 [Pisolithus microcarpus 441]
MLLETSPPQTSQGPIDMPQKVVTECDHNTTDGRNLVVCIDGTSNKFGKKNTNVIELYNLILKSKDSKQQTWYNSGIGTYARPSWKSFSYYKKVIYHTIDLAIAWNFERTVLGAYRWLSDNYEDGDCIFLFGFSRGAYQVRVLSAMIDKVGLIYKGNEMQIPFAYELYADLTSGEMVKGVGEEADSEMSMAERFKKAFSYKGVKVHFVGAWDTVSSIGLVRGRKLLPSTAEGMKHVCYFRHALALDECRVKFLPEYTYGGTATDITDKSSEEMPCKEVVADADIREQKEPERKFPKVKEVWFPGTHSDIGGGNVNNPTMDRSRPPLRWMAFEAGEVGLRTAGFKRELPPAPDVSGSSLTWPWMTLEILPFGRLTFSREKGKGNNFTSKPHLGKSRKIHKGQRIHGSFFDIENKAYVPKARPPKDAEDFWSNLRKCPEWQEFDVDASMQKTVEGFLTNPNHDPNVLQNLSKLVASGLRQQALYTKIMTTLKDSSVPGKIKYRLLAAAVDILGKHSSGASPLILDRWIDIAPILEGLKTDNDDYNEKVVRDFKIKLTQQPLLHAPSACRSVAFSHDGKLVVSGHSNGTVRLWSMETTEALEPPLKGHRGMVRSVAFSPDGKHVVSGSEDKTVRLWNAETREADGRPLEGHRSRVESVAFSPDGKHVVSGSDDATVRLWNVETREADGTLEGHRFPVTSVAFSPDGKRIVSGSWDGMVRLWNVETREADGTLEGRTHPVTSVAFSPDSKHVVSGSWDHTVRLWNVETRQADGSPLEGHTGNVESVAFSPDGKHVVSGSWDGTVRLWNVETREADGPPLEAHIWVVPSVAFSPDGNWIISGSLDSTLRLWDRWTYCLTDPS